MRNRTSDLQIPHSNALPLSHRDSTVSKVYYKLLIFLYLNNWKQTVPSIVSELLVCCKLVLLSLVQGLEHSVIEKSNSSAVDFLQLYLKPYYPTISIIFNWKFSGLKRISNF